MLCFPSTDKSQLKHVDNLTRQSKPLEMAVLHFQNHPQEITSLDPVLIGIVSITDAARVSLLSLLTPMFAIFSFVEHEIRSFGAFSCHKLIHSKSNAGGQMLSHEEEMRIVGILQQRA